MEANQDIKRCDEKTHTDIANIRAIVIISQSFFNKSSTDVFINFELYHCIIELFILK